MERLAIPFWLTLVLGATIGETVRLFDPLAYAGSVLCIVAASLCAELVPELRAGRVDPWRR
jgi:hypothetical protein